jgi:hypothetical protein
MSATDSIATIATAIAEARAAAADGAAIDLAGLVAAVDAAMIEAKAAPAIERGVLVAELATLLEELNGLVAALSRQQNAGAQQRATTAYGGKR